MKKIITLLAALMLAFNLLPANAPQDKKTKDLAEITFQSDIDCPNCVKKIQDNMPFEKGVKDLKVNLESQTIWIKYQTSKTDVPTLKKAIEKLGHTAEVKKQ